MYRFSVGEDQLFPKEDTTAQVVLKRESRRRFSEASGFIRQGRTFVRAVVGRTLHPPSF